MERRLAAILAADVVGYSRLMERDEAGTLDALKAHRADLIDPAIAEHHGRLVKLMGDGALVEFASVVDAVACAAGIQREMDARNRAAPEDRRIEFRVGVHLGDVIVEGDDLYGDGVNVAARLEGLAEPGGICISQQAYDQVETKLDLGFEDMGEQQVKNIARPVRAYRVLIDGRPPAPAARRQWALTRGRTISAGLAVILVAAGAGAAWWRPWAPDLEPASVESYAFPLPDKPSIAVLPFDNLSGDPNQSHLVDGITETIITELSRFGGLFVIARNSVLAYKDKPVKVQQVAEELGVQFVLEGSVQRSADRIRITAQLIDAITGTHLWAQRYDREMSDIFAVQDEVTGRIVASLAAYQGELAEAAKERAKRKDPASLSAYEALQLGIEHKHRFTKQDNAAAQTLFNKAIELDPQYAQAYVGLAWVHIQNFWFGWTDEPGQAVARTREAAQKAIALDPSEAEAHWLLAEAYLADSNFDQGEAAYERALALNPNHADLLAGWGYASVLLGRPERGTEFLKKAMRLNPHYPDWYDRGLGTAAYMSQRYEEAVAAFKKVTQHVIQSRLYLAASYAQLDRLEEARAEVAAAIDLDADISVEKFSSIEIYRKPADLEHLRSGLRAAGLRETAPASVERFAFPLPEKPSIAVLAFDNLSGDPAQDYWIDGTTEAIITALSKTPNLFVIARSSTFTYKGQAVKVREIAEEFGVRYVLEGSIQRAGDRVRVNAQLIDGLSGRHVWAEQFDRTFDDLFALQDDLKREVVTALEVELTEGEQARIWRRQTDNQEAYELFRNALDLYRRRNKADNQEARKLFAEAAAADPGFADATCLVGFTYFRAGLNGWERPRGETFAKGRELAERAIALDPDYAHAYALLGAIATWSGNIEVAIARYEKSLDLEPNYSGNVAGYADALVYAGRGAEAVEQIERAMRLSPYYPSWYLLAAGNAYRLADRMDDAVAAFEKRVERSPKSAFAKMWLAGLYAELGRQADAEALMAKAREGADWLTLEMAAGYLPYQDAVEREAILDYLRKAGLPET